MSSRKSKALAVVFNHPPYREQGFVVDIRKSGTIVLNAGKTAGNNEFMHSLSKEDSDYILNIIRMSINEERL